MFGRSAVDLADSVEARMQGLMELWLSLGKNGPAGNSDDAGDADFCKERYLYPLGRLLIGALRGSSNHRTIYLDERTRYLPPGTEPGASAALLERRLAVETPRVAALLASEKLPAGTIAELLNDLHSVLLRIPGKKRIRLLFLGDCLFVETRAFLRQLALEKGIDLEIDHVFFSAGQCAFSVDDAIASIRRKTPDLIGISLFSFEGIPFYTPLLREAGKLTSSQLDGRVTALIDILANAVDSIRGVTDAPIMLHNACGFPLEGVRRRYDFLPPISRAQLRAVTLIASKVAELAQSRENTLVVDEHELVKSGGGRRECFRRVFDRSDVPIGVVHPSRFGNILAKHYLEVIEGYKILGKAKVLLVDFDNTLWQGVMAEGPVSHDRERQRLLRRLKDAGILLVALSKNDPASIRWDEMALQPDDFVLLKIGWDPKPAMVSQAVAELDLAASAFVLLDDNPVERALVTEQVLGVNALDPALPLTWRSLERWLNFPSTKQTEEAHRRTDLYREAAERRKSVEGKHDYPSMMRSLELRLGFRYAKASDMSRLLELTQRTNQFNTTTKRRSAADIQKLLNSDSQRIYVASLRDRFGSLGVVAVATIERTADDQVIFDSVIMSCRAMGFGLEQALIRKVIDREPARRYVGLFVPTERNGPAAGLFQSVGFREADGGWVLETTDRPVPVPQWFAEDNV